jgi:hypothetical protein
MRIGLLVPVTVEEWDHVVAVLELAGFTSSTGGSSTAMAFVRVAGNTGANTPGVDGLTAAAIRESIKVPGFLDDLRAQLKAGTFRPLPVRERKIPKPGRVGEGPQARHSGRCRSRPCSRAWHPPDAHWRGHREPDGRVDRTTGPQPLPQLRRAVRGRAG